MVPVVPVYQTERESYPFEQSIALVDAAAVVRPVSRATRPPTGFTTVCAHAGEHRRNSPMSQNSRFIDDLL
jgi:hypothetical protein